MMDQDAKLKKALYDKEYRLRAGIPERNKAYQAQYYQEHKEKKSQYFADLYQKKSDAIKERSKLDYSLNQKARSLKKSQWKQNNKNKLAFYTAKRRASEKNATPLWADINKIQEFYDTANGLSMLTGIWYHVDHIIPLTSKKVCGLHTQGNLQVIPAKENLSKHNKILEFV